MGCLIFAGAVNAQDINFSQVTTSTNLEASIDFEITQINDGIAISPTQAGFVALSATAPNGDTGYIDFTFSENMDLKAAKIWNGIEGPISGFSAIRFEFFNAARVNIYDYPARPQDIDQNNTREQRIAFSVNGAQNVRRVRLWLFDASGVAGIQRGMREVTFEGEPSLKPIPPPKELQPESPTPKLSNNFGLIGIFLAAATLLAAIGLALKFIKGSSAAASPTSSFSKSQLTRPERSNQGGVVFPSSPVVAGALTPGPAPLAPAGQMIPSGLQTLTGQYAALKPAYRATGRIGGPQDGIPTNDDVAFGTGFLITPNHIMTNQHVYEFYKHYLTGPDCGGIEFIAERDRDVSDYVPFNGDAPLILPDLDIAIFTLAREVTDRKPIKRISVPTDQLDEREVITVSYPCPFEVDEHILSVVEKDPIFAVKRLSQGRIFRHTTDTDAPFGVQVKVDARIHPEEILPAICHNASTLGGSSGAPVLDISGNLVGVHFAGDRAFNGEEAANLAMAIEMLAAAGPTEVKKETRS